MTSEPLEHLRLRISRIESMPAIPVILRPLLHCLDQPVEQVDLARFTFSLDEYAREVSEIVATVFKS